MSVFNSLNVSVLVVLLVAGLVLGLSLAGIDLLNPNTSAAEANRMDIESAHKQAMYGLEERRAAAQTESEIRQIEREQKMLDAQYEHDIQALTLSLQHTDLAFKTLMIILTFLAGAVSVSITVISIVWVASRKSAATKGQVVSEQRLAQTPNAEQKDDEMKKYWQQQRQWARDNEEWFRSVALMEARLKTATNPQSPDSDQRSNLPLAI